MSETKKNGLTWGLITTLVMGGCATLMPSLWPIVVASAAITGGIGLMSDNRPERVRVPVQSRQKPNGP